MRDGSLFAVEETSGRGWRCSARGIAQLQLSALGRQDPKMNEAATDRISA